MKKIIYSLVIMIAAGSLFTSCVNYEEPVGVQDLREAKASYLDALSALRAADAELQLAYAEVQKSIAAKNNADAAYRNAQVEYQKLVNAAKEIENATDKAQSDQKIAEAQKLAAKAKAEAEEAAKVHAINMANLEKQLSDLQKKIDAESLGLTAAEKKAVQDAINYYTTALGLYNTAAGEVAKAEQDLYDAENGFGASKTEAQFTDSLNKAIETEKANIAAAQATIEAINNNETLNDWQDYLAELEAEKVQNNYLKTQYEANEQVILQTEFVDAQYNANAEVAAWLKANTPQLQPKGVKYTNNKGVQVDVLSKSIWFQGLIQNYANQITGVSPFTWTVNTVAPATVDAWLNGDEDATNLYQQIGFNGIIKTVEDSKILEPDTTTVKGLEAKSVELDSTYRAHLDIIKAGRKAFIDSNAAVIAAKADTTVKADSLVLLKDNLTKAKEDSTNLFKAYKNEVDTLIAARKALAQAAKDINEEGIVGGIAATSYSSADVVALLAAIKNFVAAKQAVFGEQSTDTLSYYKEGTLVPTLEKLAIADLEASDLVQTIDSIKVEEDSIFFKVSNQFTALKPYQSESVRGGFVDYSYAVAYGFARANTSTNGWVKYADSLATKYGITSAALANARLSKPYVTEEAGEVFTVIFKALGLVPSFWYSSEPNLTKGSATESNWYDIVLAENPDANKLDALFSFEIGKPYTVQITASEVGKPFGLYYNQSGDKSYQPDTCLAAANSVKNAREAANSYETTYENSVKALATAETAAFNEYATISNNFYGYVRGIDAFIENEFTAERYASAMTATEWAAWDANKKAEVEQFEYCVSKLDSYVEYTLDGTLDVNGELAVVEDLLTQGGAIDDINALKAFVFGNNYNSTEYAKAKIAEFKHKIVSEQKDAVEYFAAFKAWVKGLEDALVAANDANKAYYEAWDEFAKKFYGRSILDKKGQVAELALAIQYSNILDQSTPNPIYDEGVYTCSAYAAQNFVITSSTSYDKATEETSFLAEIYAKYFAEIDETLYALDENIIYFTYRNLAIDELVEDINYIIAKYLDDNSTVVSNPADIAAAVKQLVDDQTGKINTAQGKIDNAEAALAKLAAGVDAQQVAVEGAQRALEAAQAKLAAAEEVLAIAKAQYDAVIAKYVK